MKIYVDNYKPIQLLPIMSCLDNYFISSEDRVDVYTETGQYYINENTIFQITDHKDVPLIYYKIDKLNLILDKSSFSLKKVHHLPNNHTNNHITIMKYAIKKSSPFYMIIEGNSVEKEENKFSHFIPHHFYFEIKNENISLENCKEDLFEFLSLLN